MSINILNNATVYVNWQNFQVEIYPAMNPNLDPTHHAAQPIIQGFPRTHAGLAALERLTMSLLFQGHDIHVVTLDGTVTTFLADRDDNAPLR